VVWCIVGWAAVYVYCKYSAASTVATRSWTVDDFFLCIDHFYIMSTINKPNRFYSMFFTLICIIYLVFSIFIPNGVLYIVFTSETREICCKSQNEIIRLHRPLLWSSWLRYVGCLVEINGTDNDVNIRISRLTSIFQVTGHRWHSCACCIRPYKYSYCSGELLLLLLMLMTAPSSSRWCSRPRELLCKYDTLRRPQWIWLVLWGW